MRSTTSRLDLLVLPVLFSAILSCDLRDKGQVAPSEGAISLAPRLVMATGDSVVKVDSVRFQVDYGGRAPLDTTLGYGQHSVRFDGIPVGAHWTMSVAGLHKAVDNEHIATWWQGKDSGSATANAGTVQWTLTKVTLGDTTTPRFLLSTGIPSTSDSLPSGTSQIAVSFKVADTDTVYRNDTVVSRKADSAGTYSFPVDVPAAIRIKLVSPSGNVAIDTFVYTVSRDAKTDTAAPAIAFVAPPLDTILVASPSTFLVVVAPVSPSGIDSVAIAGHVLHGTPWSWNVPVTAGPNAVSATVFASNGKVATETRTITLPKLSGDPTPPTVTRKSPLSLSRIDTLPWRDSTLLLSWTATAKTGTPKVFLDGVPFAPVSDSIWTTTLTAAVGLDTFILLAKDSIGNSAADTVIVRRLPDLTAPAMHRLGSADTTLAFRTGSVLLSWIVTDSNTVASVKSSGKALTASDSLYTLAVSLPKASLGFDTTIRIVATDPAGNSSSDTLHVTVQKDTTHPQVVADASTKDTLLPYGTTSYRVSWTITDLDTVVKVSVNGSQVVGVGAEYSSSISLSRDTVPVVLVAVDSAGNTTRDTLTLRVATYSGGLPPAKPSVTGRNPSLSLKIDTLPWGAKTIPLSWTISSSGILSVSVNGKALPTTDLSRGTWTTTDSLAVGMNTFDLAAEDTSGNFVYDTASILRRADTTHPVVRLSGSGDTTVPFRTPGVVLSWTATDSDTVVSVTANRKKASFLGGSGYADTLSLPKASLGYTDTVVLAATDRAGNTTADTVRVHVQKDTSMPVIQWLDGNPVKLAYGTPRYVAKWKVWDPDAMKSVFVNHVAATMLSDSIYADTVVLSKAGKGSDSTLVLVAVDSAGNADTCTVDVVVQPDATPPQVTRNPGTSDTTLPYDTKTYPVSWTVTDSDGVSGVTLTANNLPVTVTQGSGGKYSAAISFAGSTDQVLVLVATDMAGNTTSDQLQLQAIPDTSTQLTSLSVDYGTLQPAFSPSIDSYVDTLPFGSGTPSFTVLPTAYETVTYNGGSANRSTPVVVDTTGSVVVVNTWTGAKRTYTVRFHRITIPWKTGITYGTFTDARDGRTYRTIQFGGLTWMAQNLDYSPGGTLGICAANSADSCEKYGRLYSWAEVMGAAAIYNTDSLGAATPAPGICPTGFHVPSLDEFTLWDNAYPSNSAYEVKSSAPGVWQTNNGLDVAGFNGLPAGFDYGTDIYYQPSSLGSGAWWWTSTEYNTGSTAREAQLLDGYNILSANYGDKAQRNSLRCVAP
ncbi:MAG TPA: FISUMP domain-containing protein [Fibrobacteria bacterium]|nr:FISUMP domain-containing protein [Fibrobacteria bacterium]